MATSRFRIGSSVGKKLLTGLTGLALIVFIILHLAGNLYLLVGAEAFNAYTESIEHLGWLLTAVELGLAAVIAVHAVFAVRVWIDKRRARSVRNHLARSKGAPSKQSFFSRSMIGTGAVLLVFLVVHVIQFRFGPSIEQGYVAVVDGHQVRDLHRLVVETFRSPLWTGAYLAVMVLLGFHLRHGFWSAFQSLGALGPRLRPIAYSTAAVFAVVMALGFFVLPLYFFLAVNRG